MSAPSETEQLRQLALDHLWMHHAGWDQMARDGEPLIVVEGRGLRVKDADGNWWIDVNGGYASVNVGYGREEIAQAVYEQMCRITYFPQRTTNPPTIRLAARLAELTPGGLSRAFLVSGGSEANETALKIARACHRRRGESGRYKVISRRNSYHGASGGVLWMGSVTGVPRSDYEPAFPGMLYAPQPNYYRCELGSQNRSECAVRCAKAIEQLIVFHQPETVAAVIAEPISSGAGAVVPGDEYWPMVRDICSKYGVILIVDEVITGFGRTGKLFAIDHFGVVPDIMTVAKGISSTYLPLGAAIADREIANLFADDGHHLRHVFTSAGHPVAAAAGLKNIEILEQDRMIDNAATVGCYFKDRLRELQERHRIIGDVRGLGLMLCVELVADRQSKASFPEDAKVVERLNAGFKRHGLLLRAMGEVLVNMSPPLCITTVEVDEIISGIDQTLSDVTRDIGL